MHDTTALNQFLSDVFRLNESTSTYETARIVAINIDGEGVQSIVLQIDLDAAAVTNLTMGDVSQSGESGFDVSLQYETINFSTSLTDEFGDAAGSIDFGWDVTTNKALDAAASALETAANTGSSDADDAQYYIYMDGQDGGQMVNGIGGSFAFDAFSQVFATSYDPSSKGGGGSTSSVEAQLGSWGISLADAVLWCRCWAKTARW